jgi:hypothetical protein
VINRQREEEAIKSLSPDRRANPSGDVATGLVEYFVISLPDLDSLAEVVPALAELVDRGIVRILDLVALVRATDGTVTVLELEVVPSLAALGQVAGDVGGMLSERDVELASFAIQPGSAGVVLVTEDCWARPLAEAAARVAGQIVAGERIPARRVEAVLATASENAEEV